MIENILYFITADHVNLFRANPAHAVFSCLWGYALGAWMSREKSFIQFAGFLLLSMGLHALWNLSCSVNVFFFLAVALFVFAIWFVPVRRILSEQVGYAKKSPNAGILSGKNAFFRIAGKCTQACDVIRKDSTMRSS